MRNKKKKKTTEKEIIEEADNYIEYMINFCKNNRNAKYNKRAISDFRELQALMNVYKYGANEYREIAYKYIKAIFT